MCEDTLVRLAVAQYVQNFVDDPNCMLKDTVTPDAVVRLKKYLRERNIPYPVIPSDRRGEDVVTVMYRVWASIECLDCMCRLNGEDNDRI